MPSDKPKNVRIVPIGCAKSEVACEEIAGGLPEIGNSVDWFSDAEITVINKRGFLESGRRA